MSNKYNVSAHAGNNREKDETVQLVSSASHDHDSSFQRNGKASETSTLEEKEKFLSPVTLDPGCDSVNFTPDPEIVKAHGEKEPLDRYRMVFIIMVIHGMGVLMPWNMFITAKSYFENYKLDTPISRNASYRLEFLFYLGIASQVSNVVISALNTFVQFGAQASTRRIAMAIFIIVIVFILTVVLAIVDSSQWPLEFFAITMVSVVILNCCAGVYQNSVFGQAAILPMKYTNAIVLGNNLCGIFTSVINVISIAASPSPKTAAVYYFIVAIVILLVAFDAYFVLPLTKFYQHFQKKVKGAKAKSNMTCADYSEQFVKSCKMYWQVFKEIWVQALCVFFVFFVSLSIFPAIQSGVVGMEIAMSPDYFVTLFCFLNFNLFAFIGNLVSEFVKFVQNMCGFQFFCEFSLFLSSFCVITTQQSGHYRSSLVVTMHTL
ncbi:hypothetical protein ACJMK2_005546 [Sinanodonta woodiana]|uniref:Equilibrative nucleoside transporter 3 n=1 Tax=Sinanodonta woodiana TaxID=1069815 RepID=A0ABD3VRQ0_SINWO